MTYVKNLLFRKCLGRRRQSVAHGVVAAAADVRAVDGGEVTVGLG